MKSNFKYTLHRTPRTRRITITITPKGVRVSAPMRASVSTIEKFIQEKQSWIEKTLATFEKKKENWIKPPDTTHDTYVHSKARAKKFIIERVREYNKHYQFSYNRISVKDLSSRWGSCSSQGNLNFHYRLFFLPPELADYVVVHELCHLQQMNHTKKFWSLVAQTIPDHVKRRKALHNYQI